MKVKIAVGQRYIDDEGAIFEVVDVSRRQLTLMSDDDELVVADVSDFLADLASGEYQIADDDDSESEHE